MSCTNNINTNCGCENNPCGCKTSTDDVVYQGPDLDCVGVVNCDTLTSVFESIDGFICGPGMVETIINNITNNISLYSQFTTIVNNTVDCETVWGCETTTTTTTVVEECHYYTLQGATNPGIWSAALCNPGKDPVYTGGLLTGGQSAQTPCIVPSSLVLAGVFIKQDMGPCPTTTTTTTVCTACTEWFWQAIGANASALEYLDCDGVLVEIPIIDVTNTSGYICTENGSAPTWTPTPTVGTHTLSQQGCCDTTTTTTTLPL